MSSPTPCRDDVEQPADEEAQLIQRCIDSMYRTNATMTFDVHRHRYRATRARS